MKKFIRVLIKEPGKAAEMRMIENTLESLQKIVGGYIETVTMFVDLVVICNEEGRIKEMPFNCELFGVDFVGTIILAGVDGEEFGDAPMDEETWREYFPRLFDEDAQR